jgi:hypothetical protein
MTYRFALAAAAVISVAHATAVSTKEAYINTSKSCGTVPLWTSDCVKTFLGSVGFPAEVLETVEKNGITGSILLELTPDDHAILNIGNELDKKRWAAVDKELNQAINAGRVLPGSEISDGSATDLWELRAQNRAGFSRLLQWLHVLPGLSTLYLHFYAEDNSLLLFDKVHERSTFSWVSWILFPQAMLISHLSNFYDTNPYLAAGLMLCFLAQGIIAWGFFLARLSLLVSGLRGAEAVVIEQYIRETIALVFGALIANYIVWPLTPRFLSDVAFYVQPLANVLLQISLVVKSVTEMRAKMMLLSFQEDLKRW